MTRCVLLSCLFAGCASSPNVPAPALAPFAAASRFVPDGMLSFAFLRDWPDGWPQLRSAAHAIWADRKADQIWAGRDFGEPDLGVGPSYTICIADFGPRGVDVAMLAELRDPKLAEVAIGTQACWYLARDPEARVGNQDEWLTVVDDRFLLLAHHREVLAAALQQRGDLGRTLAAFGDLSFLPRDATDLIFNLPRPEEVDRWGHMPPLAPMVFTVTPGPWRAAMFSRQPPHADFQRTMRDLWSRADPPVRQVGAWLCQEDRMRPQQPVHEQPWGLFVVWALFGYRTFI